jgi:cytoskeletal protein CcmA (bactofilin family)
MGLFGFGESRPMGRVDTIIGEEASLRGTYNSRHSIRVDGEIYGNVTSDDGVIVGDKGMVRGNLTGRSILIGGKVKGNITATQRLEIQATAEVEGDISAPVLIIEEGAEFEGSCRMEDEGKVVNIQKAKEN